MQELSLAISAVRILNARITYERRKDLRQNVDCGNTLNTKNGSGGTLNSNRCLNNCAGNNTQRCGGANAMTLYKKSTLTVRLMV